MTGLPGVGSLAVNDVKELIEVNRGRDCGGHLEVLEIPGKTDSK